MNGSIPDKAGYDRAGLERLDFEGLDPVRPETATAATTGRAGVLPWSMAAPGAAGAAPRIAVISNPRSHRNRKDPLVVPDEGSTALFEPRTRDDLRAVLGALAAAGTQLLVIAGGDGTVRDVLTRSASFWEDRCPAIAILPRGKTNALALDIGVPRDWTVADAIAAWRRGSTRSRPPIEITRDRPGETVRGFLFGAGMFVDATDLAQQTHRIGAVNNLAVGLSILWTAGKVVFGRDDDAWRAGRHMAIRYGGDARALHDAPLDSEGPRFIALFSTLERMPLGVRPFGPARPGLKACVVDAPPRHFLRNLTRAIAGSEAETLERHGLHRVDASQVDIDLEGGFILDGERFPAGRYQLREGAPVPFVAP